MQNLYLIVQESFQDNDTEEIREIRFLNKETRDSYFSRWKEEQKKRNSLEIIENTEFSMIQATGNWKYKTYIIDITEIYCTSFTIEEYGAMLIMSDGNTIYPNF